VPNDDIIVASAKMLFTEEDKHAVKILCEEKVLLWQRSSASTENGRQQNFHWCHSDVIIGYSIAK